MFVKIVTHSDYDATINSAVIPVITNIIRSGNSFVSENVN